VALKAAKWALVGPVLSAYGGQEGGSSEFSDSLSKLSEKWFEQHLKREFGGYKEDEMGRKVRFWRFTESRCGWLETFQTVSLGR
jgi:hypothetical protein